MEIAIDSNIQRIKDCVVSTIDKEGALASASPIWSNCLDLLSYIADLTPKHLRNIRLHTEIFSGEFFNSILFGSNVRTGQSYAEDLGYIFATENLSKQYWISEPLIDGWEINNRIFGTKYNDTVVNPEIARYQLYVENFVNTGMLDHIEKSVLRSVVLEIGAGYGAIGYNLIKMTNKKVCYIVLDLPLMLLYTGCYIATHIPDAKIFIYNPDDELHKSLDDSILNYDVVLIPSHRLSILERLSRIDYAINTISMAEMTPVQVKQYLDFIKPRLTHYFYYQNYPGLTSTPLHYFVRQEFHEVKPSLDFFDNFTNSLGIKVEAIY